MKFLKGCLGVYVAVLVMVYIHNAFHLPFLPVTMQDPSTLEFSWEVYLFEMVPFILSFGSLFIIPGCLMGELVYRNVYSTKNIPLDLPGVPLFGILGYFYVLLLGAGSVSDLSGAFFFYTTTIVGSIAFYLLRRDAEETGNKGFFTRTLY